MASLLRSGSPAPEFTLPMAPNQKVSLSKFRGKNVVLVFYPADWSPVCTDELALYTELRDEFSDLNAEVLGISVDGVWSHQAFSKDRHYSMPLLSDFEPKGAVAKAYGAYSDIDGMCERALFVIDKNGVIQWSEISPMNQNPGAEGVLKTLEGLRS